MLKSPDGQGHEASKFQTLRLRNALERPEAQGDKVSKFQTSRLRNALERSDAHEETLDLPEKLK